MATATCIPFAVGVPGLPGAPNWYDSAQTPPKYYTELDDPRWQGSAQQEFPLTLGSAPEANFRGLSDFQNINELTNIYNMYLSFDVTFDPSVNNGQDILYVGLANSAGTQAMVIRMVVYNNSSADFSDGAVDGAPGAGSIQIYTWNGATWDKAATQPAWIDKTARAWLKTSPKVTWAVEMVVPLNSSSASLLDDIGPNIPGPDLKVWYCMAVMTPTNVNGLVFYKWPGTTTNPSNTVSSMNLPVPSTWDNFHLGPAGGGTTCTSGVSLSWDNIGTTNVPNSQINYSSVDPRPVNTFFARPKNDTGTAINPNVMTARFRIANWGSIATPATWVDIPGGTVTNVLTIPTGPVNPANNLFQFNWALNNTDIANLITGKSKHKCMLVELSAAGSGITFTNSSVYRNMDFVGASLFSRAARINIEGLAPIPGGGPLRDTYLAVERLNMPATMPKDTPPPAPQPGGGTSDGPGPIGLTHLDYNSDRYQARVADAMRGNVPAADIETFMPTYRVHVYHDTGEKVQLDGKEFRVLEPQTGFGYYVTHTGRLDGWATTLTGAQLQLVAPNFYHLPIPEGGEAEVTTTVAALEGGCLEVLRHLLGPFGFIVDWIMKLFNQT